MTERIREQAVVRFAGDSGDGIQLAGSQFTLASAVAGNDLATLPDFPAEIRAPAGTLYGVSGFQIQFAANNAFTPGDRPDALVAMNPAALKRNLQDLPSGATLIVDSDSFVARNLKLLGWENSPLDDGSLGDFTVHAMPMTSLTLAAVKESGIPKKAARRCANFFALGFCYWLYGRPLEPTLDFIGTKFAAELAAANSIALKAGYHYGETVEGLPSPISVPAADIPPGRYRTVNGNQALVLGLVTAARKAGLDCCFAGYPITPASSILEAFAGLRHMGVRCIQAEDEIAAIGMALGAAWGGGLGITASSGPGIDLKGEFIGLASCVELPLVIIDIQRGGPSTGLPTKTEQSDLFLALHGRHGEAPLPVLAARSPADAFDCAIEAARLAIRAMSPVILLSDGSIANGAEPWLIPDPAAIPAIERPALPAPEAFQPYQRDEKTLARPWAVPGTPGYRHRIGGLEKEHESGAISYDPDNHEQMTRLRAEKIERLADDYAPLAVDGPDDGPLLLLGWGSTYGAIAAACAAARSQGMEVAHCHLRHIHPLPKDLGAALRRYQRVLIPEINSGQLVQLIRARYLIDAQGWNRVRGQPLRVSELTDAIRQHWEDRT